MIPPVHVDSAIALFAHLEYQFSNGFVSVAIMMPKHVWHEYDLSSGFLFKMLATLHVNALYQNIHIFWQFFLKS